MVRNALHDAACRAWDALWPARRPLVSRAEYNAKLWVGDVVAPQGDKLEAVSDGLESLRQVVASLALRLAEPAPTDELRRIATQTDKVERAVSDFEKRLAPASLHAKVTASAAELAAVANELRRLAARQGPPSGAHLGPEVNHPERIVFLHLAKTGGSALREFIAAQVGVPGGRAVSLPGPEDVTEEVLRRPFIVGHIGVDVLDRVEHPLVSITVLREPVDRALSFFSFTRYSELAPTAPIAARAEREWLRAMSLEEFARAAPQNEATSMLGGTQGDDSERLARAKERLRSIDIVGVQERLWETAAAVCMVMGWTFGGRVPLRNTTEQRVHRDEVPDSVIDVLVERNRLDQELYAFAEQLSADRWRQTVATMLDRLST